MIRNFNWLLLVSLTFVACSTSDDTTPSEVITPGTANFSKYVAIGDSFSAGYSDGALYKKAQENSYPDILSRQFALAGGGAFLTPFMVDNIGGFSLGGNQIPQFPTRFYFNGVAPVNVTGVSGTSITARLTGSYNNLGIPGAKSFHLLFPGYATLNPYFGRFSSSATATIMEDALSQNPSFFSLWIGGNDVLAYATSGGVGVNQTGNMNPANYGFNDITDPTVFQSTYNGLVAQLVAGGRKGVVANLPYVSTLPFFTTVPYNPLTNSLLGNGNSAVGVATVQLLNDQLYGPLKQALTAFGAGDRINLLSTTVANPLLINDETLPDLSAQLTAAFTPTLGAQTAAFYGQVFGRARQAKNTDYVLLTTRNVIGTAPSGVPAPLDKFGITYPLQDQHVLIASEAAEVKVATDAYNVTISNAAQANGLAFVDAKAIMNQLFFGGIRFGNYHMSTTFVTGGAFSLDGVHPSSRGYALIANKFLEAINEKYGSNIPASDLAKYPIQYPAVIN